MRNLAIVAGALSAILAIPSVARADRTFLVGGTVIEGTATRKGGKVIIEVESGQITLPADTVARIEKSESTVSRYDERYRALAPAAERNVNDLQARLLHESRRKDLRRAAGIDAHAQLSRIDARILQ